MSAEDEELRRQLEEQLAGLQVEDVLVQSVVTFLNLGARRLEEGNRDQARLAIESVRALLPLCPPEVQQALRDPLSQLQLAFAKPGGEGEAAPGPEPEPPKPESKLWTPPGS